MDWFHTAQLLVARAAAGFVNAVGFAVGLVTRNSEKYWRIVFDMDRVTCIDLAWTSSDEEKH